MNHDELMMALLARGYFPKELPPPFSSASFAKRLDEIKPGWDACENDAAAKKRHLYPRVSKSARFDMARKGHSRRMLSVPNPVNQYYLVKEICDNYPDIIEKLSQSKISITRSDICFDGKRAVTIPTLSSLSERRIKAYSTAKAILQTDILSFYHSIYTHSIPWALHGKDEAKARRTFSPQYYGNKVDAMMRSCQDGQTMGIPVGPDTSRLVSEFILCAIEKNIDRKLVDKIIGGYRYIDDFFLCFSSYTDAEVFLTALRDSVSDFDLQLNASKTYISDALNFNEESWPGEIPQLKLSGSRDNQRQNIIRFFTEVIRLSKSLPDESIASFAIRKTSRCLIHRENWELYESFILRLARENSNCTDSVVKIICTYAACGYPVSERVKAFAEGMLEEHAPRNHHYEVVWILWLCCSMSIKLGDRASKIAAKVPNSLCACLVYMLRGQHLLTGRHSISGWVGTMDEKALSGEHWMVVYESGTRSGWRLSGSKELVIADPHFSVLRDRKVNFFDTKATNVALDLPSIDELLKSSLGSRRTALLPGRIRFDSTKPRSKRRYEALGADYGDDEWDRTSSIHDDAIGFHDFEDIL